MGVYWGKWWQTIKVHWSNLLVYRTNFILMIVGPVLVFMFVKVSLWYSIFQGDMTKVIGNYTLSEMLSYHLWTMVVMLISRSYNFGKLSEDIRLGKVSTYLIYPFSLWEFQAASFVGRFCVQFIIALFTLGTLFWVFPQFFPGVPLEGFFKGLALCLVVGIFWFSLQYLIGLLAFWLEETWVIAVISETVFQLLSGNIIPLDLFPQWAEKLLAYTPFPYITFFPVKVFMGAEVDFTSVIVNLIFWILLLNILVAMVWRIGLKLYTGAGM